MAGVELELDVAGAELDEPLDELDEPPPPQPERARTRATSAATRPAARREVMVILWNLHCLIRRIFSSMTPGPG